MIDRRFSREAFASLGTHFDREARARELAAEICALIAAIPSPDGALSSVLARLRLVGHHLYPRGDGVFSGDDTPGAEAPTELVVCFRRDAVEVAYGRRWR